MGRQAEQYSGGGHCVCKFCQTYRAFVASTNHFFTLQKSLAALWDFQKHYLDDYIIILSKFRPLFHSFSGLLDSVQATTTSLELQMRPILLTSSLIGPFISLLTVFSQSEHSFQIYRPGTPWGENRQTTSPAGTTNLPGSGWPTGPAGDWPLVRNVSLPKLP